MSHRCLAAVFTVIVGVALAPVFAAAQSANTTAPPQTAWGQPDLQGIWDFRTITPLQRPEDLADQEFLTAEEAANLEQEAADRDARLWEQGARRAEAGGNVGAYNNFWMDRGLKAVGTRRTSLIVDPPDGRIPPLTPEGQRRADARREYLRAHPADSWLDVNSAVRCIVGFNAGPPMEPRAYNNHMQLFQTPDYVVILNEMVHDARIIPLGTGPNFPKGVLQWMGDSRGRWEGETLVVDTTNLYDKNSFTNRYGATPAMHLVEQFTRVNADTLLYEFTVEDPATWKSSWTASMPMRRTDAPMFEYACHEGNYGMEGILAGTRAEEKAAGPAANKRSR